MVKGIPKHEQAEAGRVVAPVHMEGKATLAARFAGAAVTAGGCMGMETEPMPAKARAFTGLGALPRVEVSVNGVTATTVLVLKGRRVS